MGGFSSLWCWLTEEWALIHIEHAAHPVMASIRFVARLFLGLWLAISVAATIHWFDLWGDSFRTSRWASWASWPAPS